MQLQEKSRKPKFLSNVLYDVCETKLKLGVNPKRNEGESFEDYKKRRSLQNFIIKAHLKGKKTK